MEWGTLLAGATSPASIMAIVLGVVIGIVVYGVRRLIDGRLVPRSVLEDAQRAFNERLEREKEISEAQRSANDSVVQALNDQTKQVELLIREQQLVRDVMRSMRFAAESNVASGVSQIPIKGDAA